MTDYRWYQDVFISRVMLRKDCHKPYWKERFIGNPKPMSFTKNWYSKPTPPDMQFEERIFQTQFSVSADKLYEWNIDGLSEQETMDIKLILI